MTSIKTLPMGEQKEFYYQHNNITVMAEGVCEECAGHYARRLTKEEVDHMRKTSETITAFKKNKLEQDAKKNWDLFYKRNTTHFFRDRHWITREFPELLENRTTLGDVTHGVIRSKSLVLLEAGCGVGNTVFPLMGENPNLFVYACDFSPRAIELLKAHPSCIDERCHAFVCDLTNNQLTDHVPVDCVDLVTLFFVLSAISPEKMSISLTSIFKVVKPGGRILFRDYGLYDHAMLRFGRGHKISDNFYVRQDGTRAFYFSEEKLTEMMTETGFIVEESNYVLKETVNHKEGIHVPRIFIQGRFKKPEIHTRTNH